ncbi:MAG: efflux RND transporter permease subunit [Deltaproteobacteria bacterium]|nr:efflux RND transporter permease subunit [Deltaproteobacteria bacterium]
MWSNAFYRNPRLTVLFLGLVAVAGLSALQSLARQEDPTMARRFASVRTVFPGASALRVESLVTDKLEAELRELHEIREIDSDSRTGISSLHIELEARYNEEDVDEIWSKVRDRIEQARGEFPPGVGAPDFRDQTSTAITLLVGFTWEQDGAPQLGILTRLAEELENRLRNVPGTKETDLYGEAEEEIRAKPKKRSA